MNVKRENVKRDKGARAPSLCHVSRFTFHSPPFTPAFTLIELLVVLALAAILATVAVVSLAGTARAARAQDAADQVAHYDRLTREWARRFDRPARLTFDLDGGTVSRSAAAAAGDDATADRPAALHLSAGLRFERVVWPGGSATAGQASVAVSSRGQTPSYAVLLSGNKGRAGGADQHWLVVAGLTGRTIAVNDEREVEDLFRTLAGEPAADAAPAGDDAR